MRFRRHLVTLAALFTAATAGGCVFPTEHDAAVHVSVDPLPILIRGDDTYATARAWQRLATGDSSEIANVSFVWSSDNPLIATVDPNGTSRISYWVPPPAHSARLFYIGAGVFGFSTDTVRVVRRDIYEPNETSPTLINLETSRPFPGTFLNFFLFLNPALAFEELPRGVTSGADWYRFQQTNTRDLTIVLSAPTVKGTFLAFLSDSLGWNGSKYFI